MIVADVVEDLVHRVLLVVVEHPLGEQRSAARDDADQAFLHERQMLLQHAGVDREVVDALLGLVFQFCFRIIVAVEVFDRCGR